MEKDKPIKDLEPLEIPDFIPFTSDFGFKTTFGNEKNTLFLTRALTALTQSQHKIVKVVFDKTVYSGLTQSGKSGIFDLACTDERGNTFIVEMEVRANRDFLQRLKFYAFLRFNNFIEKGEKDYDNLPKLYCISFLGKNINALPDYHNVMSFKNQDGIQVDEQMTLITVELKKFKLKKEAVKTDLEKLIYTVKNAKRMVKVAKNKQPKFMQEDWLATALHELDTKAFSPQKYEAYMRALVQEREQVKVEAKAEAKGKRAGKAEGKAEMIANMLRMNMPISQILEISNSDIAFIESVKAKLKIA